MLSILTASHFYFNNYFLQLQYGGHSDMQKITDFKMATMQNKLPHFKRLSDSEILTITLVVPQHNFSLSKGQGVQGTFREGPDCYILQFNIIEWRPL